MLPKKFRLTKKAEFQKILKSGRFFYGRLVNITFIRMDGMSRFGVIVSNKVSRKSTERNRLKRIIRGFIQDNIDNISEGVALVVVAKSASKDKNRQVLQDELSLLFKKANVI